MPTQQQTFQTQLGIGKETTWATGVVPTQYLAITAPKPKDDIISLLDMGYRGLPAKDFAYYQGVRHSEYEFETPFFPDDTGHALMGILGTDSISGGGPYTHLIGAAATLPPSYSLTDFSGLTAGGNSRRYVGSYFESVVLKWVNNGYFTATCKLQGKVSASQAKPSASYSSVAIFLPWQGVLTLNSASDANMIEFTCTIKRPIEVIYGSGGTQDPVGIVPGRLEVTGTALFAPVDETEMSLYTANTQGALSLVLTSGASVMTIQMTKCALETPSVVQRTKDYVEYAAAYRGISNATDSVSGGASQSPIKFSLVNTRSTAY